MNQIHGAILQNGTLDCSFRLPVESSARKHLTLEFSDVS